MTDEAKGSRPFSVGIFTMSTYSYEEDVPTDCLGVRTKLFY